MRPVISALAAHITTAWWRLRHQEEGITFIEFTFLVLVSVSIGMTVWRLFEWAIDQLNEVVRTNIEEIVDEITIPSTSTTI